MGVCFVIQILRVNISFFGTKIVQAECNSKFICGIAEAAHFFEVEGVVYGGLSCFMVTDILKLMSNIGEY